MPKKDSLPDEDNVEPVYTQPEQTIKGGPAIRKFHILNDKRHILTQDTDSHVAVYDVLKVIYIYSPIISVLFCFIVYLFCLVTVHFRHVKLKISEK